MAEPVLGRADATPSDQIDTFPPEGRVDRVTFSTSELTARCPVTDSPDFYQLEISYSPAERCIESKSLKLYLQTFADQGIFAEHLAPVIGRRLAEATGVPVTVRLSQQVRGGITTVVDATVAPDSTTGS